MKCALCQAELLPDEKAFCHGPCREKRAKGKATIVDQKKPATKPDVARCKECLTELPRKPGRLATYCSPECKKKAYETLGVEDGKSD